MRNKPWYKMEFFANPELLVKDIRLGLTKAEISRKYECSISSVNRAVEHFGIDYNRLKLSAKYERKCAVIDK